MSDKNKDEPKDSNEDPNFAHELNKLRLSAEHGIPMSEKKEEDYSSETEKDFLDRMRELEEAMENPDKTKIRELLGSINFPKEEELTDDEVRAALELATTAMANKNIQLDIIYPTPDREIYRFITEELMEKGSGMAGAGGMMMHFIYEEFYPNFDEDIKADVRDILHYVCRGYKGAMPWRIAQNVQLNGEPVPQAEFLELLASHRHLFEGMSFIGVDSIEIDSDPPKSHVKAVFRYYLDESSGTPGENTTEAEFDFELEYDNYVMTRLVIESFGIG